MILTCVVGLACLVGCQGLNERQKAWLNEGEQAYREKQYKVAVERLSLLIDDLKNSPEAARACYIRGMAYAQSGQRARAYADLDRAAREARDADLAWRAEAALGVLYFEDERWADAARILARATDKMPTAPPLDALLYRLGLCHERTGRWAEAQLAYRRLVDALPDGPYGEPARRRLDLKADHFAIQCDVLSQPQVAQRRVAELKSKGLSAYARPEVRKGKTYHVVLVGQYGRYADAKAALARVRGYVPQAVLWP